MNETKKNGRPKLPVDKLMVDKTIKFMPAQITKLIILGGAKWVRKQIDEAKLPRNRKKIDQAKVK